MATDSEQLELNVKGITCASCAEPRRAQSSTRSRASRRRSTSRPSGPPSATPPARSKPQHCLAPSRRPATRPLSLPRPRASAAALHPPPRGREGGRVPRPPHPPPGRACSIDPDRPDLDDPAAAVRLLAVAQPAAGRPRSSFWCGWPFHRVAWRNLRHGAASMDTLISLGTLAAWTWSVVALFFLDAGEPGMRVTFTLIPEQGSGSSEVYLRSLRSSPPSSSPAATSRRRRSGARGRRWRRCSSSASRTWPSSTPTAASGGSQRPAPGRPPLPRPPGREARDRRRRRGGALGGGRIASDRRIGAGRGRPRRRR